MNEIQQVPNMGLLLHSVNFCEFQEWDPFGENLQTTDDQTHDGWMMDLSNKELRNILQGQLLPIHEN